MKRPNKPSPSKDEPPRNLATSEGEARQIINEYIDSPCAKSSRNSPENELKPGGAGA
jgi:hypothetical protein